uniref:signal peptide peptidase SppA n=1 Tax=Flavobacterium sp. TaxID=239 RepID=UPI00404B0E1B
MKFLGNVLATILGIFFFFIIAFFGIIIIAAIFGSDDDTVDVKKKTVLTLNLEEVSLDYAGKFTDPLVKLISGGDNIGFTEVLHAIEAAKTDDNIEGISMLNINSMLGMAQMKALRDQLIDFKTSGKFIVSYSDMFFQSEYYLNSVSDTIYMNPVGMMDFKGLSSEVLFFKDFQEKTGLKMEIIRHGKYKSAVEPFIANEISDSNREQISSLLNSVWDNMIVEIGESRGIPKDTLNQIANRLGARTPKLALETKLIDKIGYEDTYHNGIKAALGVDKEKSYNIVSLSDYTKKINNTPASNSSKNEIAVIYAQGEIMAGEGDINVIGEGSIRDAIRKARRNDKVKAIVLRVDSPGGNALTAELIWRELEITKTVKPIVVSMGNYAASGGYYIAANAHKIIAEPNTITGSIGVFGMLPNMNQLAQNMGINAVTVKTHENAADYSLFQPLDPTVAEVIQESIEDIYSVFLTRVADGRKMTTEEVDAVAQGRVWTGSEALKIGLVDALGGLDLAIEEAAKLAEIEDYKTRSYPEFDKTFEDVMNSFPFAKSKESLIESEIGPEAYQTLQQIRRMNRQRGIQAIMPFEINIR